VELRRALELLAEPKGSRKSKQLLRELGPHPADGEQIAVLSGRYGPYVKHGKTNASLPKGLAPEELTVQQAVSLLQEREAAKPAKGGRKPAAKKSAGGKAGAKKSTAKKSVAKKSAAKKSTGKTSTAKKK